MKNINTQAFLSISKALSMLFCATALFIFATRQNTVNAAPRNVAGGYELISYVYRDMFFVVGFDRSKPPRKRLYHLEKVRLK